MPLRLRPSLIHQKNGQVRLGLDHLKCRQRIDARQDFELIAAENLEGLEVIGLVVDVEKLNVFETAGFGVRTHKTSGG